MKPIATLALIGAAALPSSLSAQPIGGNSRYYEECSTIRKANANAQTVCVSNERDTVIVENDYAMRGKVFTERVEGSNGPPYHVLALEPCIYRNEQCIGLNAAVQDAIARNPDNGYTIRFVSKQK